MARCLQSNNPENLTRREFRETMQSFSEVQNWIWG